MKRLVIKIFVVEILRIFLGSTFWMKKNIAIYKWIGLLCKTSGKTAQLVFNRQCAITTYNKICPSPLPTRLSYTFVFNRINTARIRNHKGTTAKFLASNSGKNRQHKSRVKHWRCASQLTATGITLLHIDHATALEVSTITNLLTGDWLPSIQLR
jgi:hypothetical protein